ncbi:Hint domain-containing protein [Microbaculum marinum]|uniref:Hint domain-containing protein n=1 Tax=Microbaculum marinum TaxID=1764581 RepID=A0AAW9RUX3_9HYPH
MPRFDYRFLLDENDNTTGPVDGPEVLNDFQDSPQDLLNTFGDIENDHLGNSGVYVYVGKTEDGEIIADFSGDKILFTNTDYTEDTHITYTTDSYYVCFAAGTLIRTPRGDVPVEALAEGDVVVTASGEQRPIRWVGSRSVDCRRSADPRQAWPVRVSADAFGRGLPERDLWLSPAHAVQVTVAEDLLVPIGSLVNGATIQQVAVETIDYHHIELDSHDVVIANGLPAESYLDCGNRGFFLGADAEGDVAPDSGRAEVDPATLPFCLPFVAHGESVDEVRARLDAQALLLGWITEDADADIAVEAGGAVLTPGEAGGRLRVTLPADATHAWLASSSWVPHHHRASSDRRDLGVAFRHLTLTDVTGEARRIRADDPRLGFGFHGVEGEGRDAIRWTTGRALLPGSLWAGMTGQVTLTLAAEAGETRRWVAPPACDAARAA